MGVETRRSTVYQRHKYHNDSIFSRRKLLLFGNVLLNSLGRPRFCKAREYRILGYNAVERFRYPVIK